MPLTTPPGVPERLLMVDETGARLVSTSCSSCGGWTFPVQDNCARCGSAEVADLLLPNRGRIWSYTVQTFRPPSPPFAPGPADGPDDFQPYGVGMVEFEGGRCVHGRLAEADREKLSIGLPVETILIPIEGDEVGFAFRPVPETEGAGQ